MADYCTNADLVAERSRIMTSGVEDWSSQIADATAIINRSLDSRWYRAACREYNIDHRDYPFNPNLLLNAAIQLKRLGVYKTLQLCYQHLSKDSVDPDAYERHAKRYREYYAAELADVLASGLDYDWDSSGSISSTERSMPTKRRLRRA